MDEAASVFAILAQYAWVAVVRRQNNRRNLTSRVALAIAILGGLPAVLAQAQGNIPERELKAAAGRDLRVGVYTDIRADCTSGPLPAIKLAVPPAHGAVTVKRGTLKATNIKQCLATEAPAFVAFYRARARFPRQRSVCPGNYVAGRPQTASAFPNRGWWWPRRRRNLAFAHLDEWRFLPMWESARNKFCVEPGTRSGAQSFSPHGSAGRAQSH